MSNPTKHKKKTSPAWGCQQHHCSASFLKAPPRTSSQEIWHQHPLKYLAWYFHKYSLVFNANNTAWLSKPSRQTSAFLFLFTEVPDLHMGGCFDSEMKLRAPSHEQLLFSGLFPFPTQFKHPPQISKRDVENGSGLNVFYWFFFPPQMSF